MNGSTSIAWTTALVFCLMLMSQGAKVSGIINSIMSQVIDLLFIYFIFIKPKRRVEFTKIECTNKYPKIVNVNCTLENFSELSADIELFEDISELRGNYTITVNHGNQTFPYVSQELDYCTVLLNVHKQPLVQMMVSEIRRVSNITLNCPFKKVSQAKE